MAARAERKLAAILAADVVGAGRFEEPAEAAGAIARLNRLRQEIVEPLIGEHRGGVVKLMGDGVLVEFASAVEAIECAIAIQKGMAGRMAETAEAGRVRYRIGVNLGNINIEGDAIFGEGIDNAARLATLAEPGGICIARVVYDEVKSNLQLNYERHSDWMHISLMSMNTPDSWSSTMDLIEVSAVRIGAAAITGQSTDAKPGGLLRHFRRLLRPAFSIVGDGARLQCRARHLLQTAHRGRTDTLCPRLMGRS